MANLARSIYELGYELSPIILTNGIATGFPGSMMPIILITQSGNFISSLIGGRDPFDTNGYFAHFRPLPGGELINNEIGDYPFANQTVAANAIIARPLRIPLLMLSPVNQPGGFVSKLITFTALKSALDKHNQSGGTYTIATPAYIYTNCIMLSMRDVSNNATNQAQNAWQFDFIRPLLALDEAAQVMNTAMSKIAGQLPTGSTSLGWSGISQAVGAVQTGLGALGGGIANFGSLNLSSLSIPGIGDIQSLSTLSSNITGTAVSGINSTIGQFTAAANGAISSSGFSGLASRIMSGG